MTLPYDPSRAMDAHQTHPVGLVPPGGAAGGVSILPQPYFSPVKQMPLPGEYQQQPGVFVPTAPVPFAAVNTDPSGFIQPVGVLTGMYYNLPPSIRNLLFLFRTRRSRCQNTRSRRHPEYICKWYTLGIWRWKYKQWSVFDVSRGPVWADPDRRGRGWIQPQSLSL